MLRIMLICESYPPAMGGVATSAKRISMHLARLGLDVVLATFDGTKPLDVSDYCLEETDEGVQVCRFGPFFLKNIDPRATQMSEKHRAMLRRRIFNQMAALCKSRPPDLIFSMYLLNAGFMAALLANALGCPHIAGVRGNDVGRNIFDIERFGVISWTLHQSLKIACVNEHLRSRLLIAFPELRERVVIVPNGVLTPTIETEPGARASLLANTGWAPDVFVVAFVGTLREKKGIVSMLEAVESLPESTDLRLILIGPPLSGVEQHLAGQRLNRLIESHRVHLTGQLPREEVGQWLDGADGVLMPSVDDGMANGLLEGMARGKCPVASVVFRDLLQNGENGVVLPDTSPQAIAFALSELSRDRVRAARLGVAARETVLRNHTPEEEARRYMDLFLNTVAEIDS